MSHTAHIHPMAVVSPLAEIAEDVEIGPYCVIEGEVQIGPECTIGPYVHLVGPLVLGPRNHIFAGAVLGERPQHLKYNGEPTRLEIGEGNIIREHVTIHRGTTHRGVTRIGNHNFFMVASHIGHDCIVGDRCMLANSALVGGHGILDDGCILSGNTAVHQRCRVGRLALLGGVSATTKDVPPFMIQQGLNCITGVNLIGLRRAGIPAESVAAIKEAYHILFDKNQPINVALKQIEEEIGGVPEVQELVHFIRHSENGINPARWTRRGAWPSDEKGEPLPTQSA